MAIQDSGSNYQFYDKRIFDNVPRSWFDEGHLVTQSADFGKVYVVDYGELLPNEDWTCRIQSLIKMLPAKVAPLSRMRAFWHLYTMDYNQLWKHWESFMKKGHDGKQTYNVPVVKFPSNYVVTAGDLTDMLGIPQGLTGPTLNSLGISALPFMMYQSICKHFYTNAVLDYLDNKNLFPDDDDAWRLSDGQNDSICVTDPNASYWNLWDVHYRDYVDDYFTSAMTSPMRGDIPFISIDGRLGSDGKPVLTPLTIRIPDGSGTKDVQLPYSIYQHLNAPSLGYETDSSGVAVTNNGLSTDTLGNNTQVQGQFPTGIDASNFGFTIVQDQLRGLVIATSILETMARTDGSYTQFVQQFFRQTPNSMDLKPRYVGGSYSPILVNEVLQTSASQVGTTAQGHGAGRGISSTDNFLGKFHSNDFGMYMLIFTIMPDTYYCKGVDRTLLRKSQEEYFLPPRARLGPQEIMNSELYVDNNMAVDDSPTGAFGLFGYQNRYDEYRYRQNLIKGLLADSTKIDFYSLTQVRDFQSLPTLSNSFVTTENNINKSFMVGQNVDSFLVQCACRFGAVRPLPYKAVPADFVN